MAIGLGPLNLNNSKNVQLKSNIGTSATAKASVIANASKVRSSGTPTRIVVDSNNNSSSGSVFFTKAMRNPTMARYQSAAGLSRALNRGRQNYGYISNFATTGIAGQRATYVQSQSTAASVGEVLGMLGAFATQGANIYKTLNDAGIFGKKSVDAGHAPQSKGNHLSSQMDKVLGGNSNISLESATGLRTASSFGSGFSADYSSIKSAIDSGNFDPQKIRTDVSALVVKSTEDLYEAKATLNVLQAQQSDNASKVETMEADVQAAKGDMDVAQKELGTSKSTLASAKDSRKTADEELGNKKAEYKNACNDVIEAETGYSSAQATVTTCETTYSSAQAKHKSATAQLQNAESALSKIPNDAEHAIERQAAEKVRDQAKAAEEQAKAEEDKAKTDLDNAKNELQKAKDKLDGAKTCKSDMLKEYSKAEKGVADAAKKCQDAQSNVDKMQSQYDAKLQNSDICQANYEKAKTTLECSESVTKEASNLSGKMKELEQNVKNADKLQASSEKSIEKFMKKNPDYAYDAGNLVENITVTGKANGKKISQMNMDELLAKKKELESAQDPDTDGIALVDSYINRYKDQVSGKVEDFDFSGDGKVRKQGESRETTQLRLSKQQQRIQNETNISSLQRIIQDAKAKGDRDTVKLAYERLSALANNNPAIDPNQWAGSDMA